MVPYKGLFLSSLTLQRAFSGLLEHTLGQKNSRTWRVRKCEQHISPCLQNHKHILITKQQPKIASDLEGKVVMKEGTAFHSLKDKEQKAFGRRRKLPQIQLCSGLTQIFLCSVMLTTQLLLYSWALTPVMRFVLVCIAISVLKSISCLEKCCLAPLKGKSRCYLIFILNINLHLGLCKHPRRWLFRNSTVLFSVEALASAPAFCQL